MYMDYWNVGLNESIGNDWRTTGAKVVHYLHTIGLPFYAELTYNWRTIGAQLAHNWRRIDEWLHD